MARPIVSDFTERWYAALPAYMRSADEDRDFPLLRYLSLIGDQVDDVEEIIDRIDYVSVFDGGAAGDTSDLVDPDAADAAWLPWLAQLVGVNLLDTLSTTERRDAISTAGSGWRAGTKGGIKLAAQTQLTGTKYIEVLDHYEGDPWAVGIRTREDETTDPQAVVDAIIALGAKPAGVEIVTAFYAASWANIEAEYPTWADIEAAGSWLVLQSTTP
jgi:hypothetical protein